MTKESEDMNSDSESSDASPSNAVEARRRWLVLGLGNPGPEYVETRHNLGFLVVEELARRRGLELRNGECSSRSASDEEVLLAQPLTFMNRSGYAARCLVERHELSVESVLVVYDEVRLPLGRLRMRSRGGPGGHRGMESILENLRSPGIARLRVGCGPEDGELDGEELVEYVLGPFAPDEVEAAEAVVRRAADAVEICLSEGVAAAMNQCNG